MSDIARELGKLSMISHRISEAQIKSLSHFCYIAFENLKKVEIEYSIDPNLDTTTDKGYIKYVLTKKIKKKNFGNKMRSTRQRCSDIEAWTKSVFWNDIKVSFFDSDGDRLDVRYGKNK